MSVGIYLVAYYLFFRILPVYIIIAAIGVFVLKLSVKARKKEQIRAVEYAANGESGAYKRKKKWIVLRVSGIILVLPLAFAAVFLTYVQINYSIECSKDLSYCVLNGKLRQAEKLLENGADPDINSLSGLHAEDGRQTLLSELCEYDGFRKPYCDGKLTEKELEMVQLLIDYGADVNAVCYSHEYSDPCHAYTEESDYYKSGDMCGYTPFLYAVQGGCVELAELLYENGADINAVDYCGYNAVAIVADNLEDENGVEMLRFLLNNGCSANTVTRFGQDMEYLVSRHYESNYRPRDNDEILQMIRQAQK